METIVDRYGRIVDILTQHGSRIRRTSPTSAMATCPAHDDAKPSLSVKAGDTSVLIYCYAGCHQTDILAVLGLTWTDLWPDDGTRKLETAHAWKEYQRAVRHANDRDHLRSVSLSTSQANNLTRRGSVEATYVYRDADNVPTAQKLRFPLINTDTGEIIGKTFIWQHYADGLIHDRLGDVKPPIYNLPDVISGVARGIPIWLVEGEKDADTLTSLGLIATTLPSTTGTNDIDLLRPLTGADVNIVVDRDHAGDTWANAITDHLTSLGARINLWQAAEGKDITDHILNGHNITQLVPYNLNGIEGQPSDVSIAVDNNQPAVDNSWIPRPILDITAQQAAETPPDILTRSCGRGTFYRGRVNGIIGEAESGKTWIALWAAAEQLRHDQPVVWIDFEDTPSATVNRLRLLGVTHQQFANFHYIQPMENLGQLQRLTMLDAIHNINPTTVIIDGFNAGMTLMGLDINSNNDATLFFTRLLIPLTQRDDQQLGPAVIYIDHISKSKDRGRGALGAQAKRAMTSGTCLLVKVKDYPAPGQTGTLKAYVDKDRPGLVRQHAAAQDYLGLIIITSEPDGDTYAVALDFRADGTPDPDATETEKATRVSDEQRMELIMRRRFEDITETGDRPARSQRWVEDQVGGNHAKTRDLLRQLRAAGFLDADNRWIRAFTWGTGQI